MAIEEDFRNLDPVLLREKYSAINLNREKIII